MESVDEDSALVSSEGRRRRRRRSLRPKDEGEPRVARAGLREKKSVATRQIDEGQGYSVDVVDNSSFKHYQFVNAEEYGLFDEKRQFLQSVVCFQVLSTAWNSNAKRDPPALKPRYLFLFSDVVFVMKLHDVSDTNTRRYRILGRLSLLDVSVEEVGDDMFDLVARGTGALRFSVGSSVTKTQTVELFRRAIRQRQARARGGATLPPSGVPSNPDDVYAAMNFALSVLEKKMRGTATEEEVLQTDALLEHALDMQERLHNPSGTTLPAAGASGTTSGLSVARSANSGVLTMQAQLQAKEAQLRAMEERAAAAEAAISRLRGTAAASDLASETRSVTLENRTLRMELEQARAQLEERDKQFFALKEELSGLKKAGRTDKSIDVAYHEGSVDDVLNRIQKGPQASASSAGGSVSSTVLDRERRDREESERRDREERDREDRERQMKERRDREEKEAEVARRAELEEASRRDRARHQKELDDRRKQEEEEEEERRRAQDDLDRRHAEEAASAAAAAARKKQEEEDAGRRKREEESALKFKQLQEAKERVDKQRAVEIDDSLSKFLTVTPVKQPKHDEDDDDDDDDSDKKRPAATPQKSRAEVVAAASAAAKRGAAAKVSEEADDDDEDEDEDLEFSTSLSEGSDEDDGADLKEFLAQHELSHLRKPLESKTDLNALRRMDLAAIRNLGLSYADASNLATALGIKVVH